VTLETVLKDAVLAIVAVLGVGRATRLLTYDDYPPVVWLRLHWAKLVRYGPWQKLVTCGWCASPYIAAGCIGWYLLADGTGWAWTWWFVWGALALSYAAVMVMVRDDPHD
jgi:hypothetical protein